MTRAYTLLAAGVAAFVVYGSLVPFHFHARPGRDAAADFRACMADRLLPQSRSDGLANFALGVPLGFALLGACPSRRGLLAVPLLAGCVGLAAAVEFGQLYVPERTCAGSDVLAQGLGAAVGMGLWVAVGGRVTRFATLAANHPKAGGRAGRLLAAYLFVVAGVQLLPLDLSASPVDVYRKLRDGKATLRPFGEGVTGDHVAKWLTLVGLFLPAGLLASRVSSLSGVEAVAGGFAVAGLTEAGQLLVSRYASTTDVLVGGVGWLVGLVVGRARLPASAAGVGWFLVLAVVWWQPFDFSGGTAPFNWVPLADLLAADYLLAADTLVMRIVLFAPFGVLAGRAGWLVAAGVAVILEAGQCMTPGRYPSSTDVVLAAAGGWLGAAGHRLATRGKT